MGIYATDDPSGKRAVNYENILRKQFGVPNKIDFNNPSHVEALLKGITHVENSTVGQKYNYPVGSYNQYYLQEDYDKTLKRLGFHSGGMAHTHGPKKSKPKKSSWKSLFTSNQAYGGPTPPVQSSSSSNNNNDNKEKYIASTKGGTTKPPKTIVTSSDSSGGVKKKIEKVYEDILDESQKPKRKKFKYGIVNYDNDLFYKVGTNVPTQLNELGDFYQEGVQVGGSIFKPLLSSDGLYGDSAIVGTAKIGQDDGLMSKKINSDVGLKYVKGGTSIENPNLSAGIGYEVNDSTAYAEVSKDLATFEVPKTPIKLTPNISLKYSEGGDWNLNPNLKFSFKSGGLLDRKRLK